MWNFITSHLFIFYLQTMDPGFKLHSSCLFLNLGLEKPILALNLLCSLHCQSSGVTGARLHGLWVALISNQIGFLFTCLITLQFWIGEKRLLVEKQKINRVTITIC